MLKFGIWKIRETVFGQIYGHSTTTFCHFVTPPPSSCPRSYWMAPILSWKLDKKGNWHSHQEWFPIGFNSKYPLRWVIVPNNDTYILKFCKFFKNSWSRWLLLMLQTCLVVFSTKLMGKHPPHFQTTYHCIRTASS